LAGPAGADAEIESPARSEKCRRSTLRWPLACPAADITRPATSWRTVPPASPAPRPWPGPGALSSSSIRCRPRSDLPWGW